jgi:hypothetical protein
LRRFLSVFRLPDKALQLRFIGTKVDLAADADDRPPDESRLFQHQFDKFAVTEFFLVQPQLLEAGAPEIEHLGSRFSVQQSLYLGTAECIFEKITLAKFDILLR